MPVREEEVRSVTRKAPNERAENENFEMVAGGIAHDFNNFLASIQTNVQSLEAHLKTKPYRIGEMLNCLREIDLAVEFSKKLATRLQEHTDHCPLHVEWIRPEYLLQGLADVLTRAAGDRSNIHLDVGEFRGFLVGNVLEMEQVIINLVQNAGESMKNGGEILVRCMECRLEQCPDLPKLRMGIPDRCCLFEISDQGCGIRQSDLKRVFHRAYSSKQQGYSHGWGLANAHHIIEKMGGVIRVRSELGAGTTFQVFLPIVGFSNGGRDTHAR
jgi:signal transduction histidine kinase